jgi:hypothetical protein
MASGELVPLLCRNVNELSTYRGCRRIDNHGGMGVL